MEANNIKAMRDALNETQSVIGKCMEILNRIPGGVPYDGLIDDVADEICDLRDSHVKLALSAQARNCDIETAEEQSARFDSYCRKHMGCFTCPLREKDGGVPKHCEFAWSQMPYEEAKGETNGSK